MKSFQVSALLAFLAVAMVAARPIPDSRVSSNLITRSGTYYPRGNVALEAESPWRKRYGSSSEGGGSSPARSESAGHWAEDTPPPSPPPGTFPGDNRSPLEQLRIGLREGRYGNASSEEGETDSDAYKTDLSADEQGRRRGGVKARTQEAGPSGAQGQSDSDSYVDPEPTDEEDNNDNDDDDGDGGSGGASDGDGGNDGGSDGDGGDAGGDETDDGDTYYWGDNDD